MPTYQFPSLFVDSDSVDVGAKYVTKEYLLDVYPSLNINLPLGGLYAWGYNGFGELGDSTINNRSSPIQSIYMGIGWKQVACTNYNVNISFSGIKTDGTLWSCGYNNYGGLGDSSTSNRSSPIQIYGGGTTWKQVSVGNNFAMAVKTDGTLWGWGWNTSGQLGLNNATSRSSPVQVGTLTSWVQVSCGSFSFSTALKSDGTLWSFGSNGNGTLGVSIPILTYRSSPVQVTGSTKWKAISCGYAHTLAIATDGTLWGWGANNYGELGITVGFGYSFPVQVSTDITWKQISCSKYLSAAIKTDNTLWMMGWNAYGQLGDSTITQRSSPVQTIAGGINWKSVSGGNYAVSAIKTDGTLWGWGYNGYGELGDNTTTNRYAPVQVGTNTNWRQVSAGYSIYGIQEMGADF